MYTDPSWRAGMRRDTDKVVHNYTHMCYTIYTQVSTVTLGDTKKKNQKKKKFS